jgi:uncharacterized protein (TIGR02246 family)
MHPPFAAARRSLAVALLAAVVGSDAAAQSLPGDHPRDGEREYLARVRAGLDSTFRAWEAAVAAHDGARVAELYAPTATLVPHAGVAIHGRRAVGDAFANVLPRMSGARLVVQRVTASGDVAAVEAEILYQVAFPSGGTYERRGPVLLAMRPHWNRGWLIEMQSGGDLPPAMAWVRAPRAALRRGEVDTVTVRVTDALGGGIPDVLVSFGDDGAGLFAPAGVSTDARGEATAVRVAGADSTVGEVRVTPSIEPHEALLALVRTVVTADSAAAGTAATGTATAGTAAGRVPRR